MPRLAKRTYSLPESLLIRFEGRLPPGERSSFVAKLLDDWLAEQDREELRRRLVEGCKAMRDDYIQTDKEWNAASDEVWRDSI